MHCTKKLLFLFLLLGCFTICGQESKEKEVLNIVTFEEVENLQQKKPKPLLILLYTDWCKICHGMKKTTFENRKVIQLLNKNFYVLLLNGEEKRAIPFLGKTFQYKPTGTNTGIHELAQELGTIKKRIAYPTTTILNAKFEIDLQLVGFLNSEKMTTILTNYK